MSQGLKETRHEDLPSSQCKTPAVCQSINATNVDADHYKVLSVPNFLTHMLKQL